MICAVVVAAMLAMTGPVVAEAMFVNREEIPVYPLYRDPVSVYSFHLIPFSVLFSPPSANAIMLTEISPLFSRNRYMILVFFAMIQVPLSFLSMMRFRWHLKQHQSG